MKHFLLLFSINVAIIFAAKIPIKSIASVGLSQEGHLSSADSREIASLQSILEYQSGNTINVPGEIEDVPKLISTTIYNIQVVDYALRAIIGLVKRSETLSAVNGYYIDIPNPVVQPYVDFYYNTCEGAFHRIEDLLNQFSLILNSGVIPPINSGELSTNGYINLPNSVVNQAYNIISELLNILENVGKQLELTAKQSINAKTNSESAKTQTIMSEVNKYAKQIAGVIQQIGGPVKQFLNGLPITQTGNTDRLYVLEIVKQFNGIVNQVLGVLINVKGYLHDIKSAIHLLQNPFGAFVINAL